LVTNNILAKTRLAHAFNVEYHDVSYAKILHTVRDYVHKGHVLISHPLSGSVKPNETPYKSIAVSQDANELDLKSLAIIEESIACCKKFDRHPPPTESALQDFMEIDYSLIESRK